VPAPAHLGLILLGLLVFGIAATGFLLVVVILGLFLFEWRVALISLLSLVAAQAAGLWWADAGAALVAGAILGREGVGSIIDLLTAQTALANARAQQVQSRWQWYSSLAQLARDAGVLGVRGDTPFSFTPDTLVPSQTPNPVRP